LSVPRIVALTKPGRYADGGGLYLQITPGGGRSWLFRFRHAGRDTWMGLGRVNLGNLEQSLLTARERAADARRVVRSGGNPLAVKRASEATLDPPGKAVTFRECAIGYLAVNEHTWRNPVHRKQWRQTLATYVYPVLGDLAVDAITTEDVRRCLEPIWRTIPETARRVRGRIEMVLDLAIARGLRTAANPATVRVVRAMLGKGLRRPKHHAALPYRELPGLMDRLDGRTDVPALALRWLILTATRSSEARGARWAEIDMERRRWTIPAERMKGNREHVVPLSAAALAVLEAVPRRGAFVFAGPSGDPISETSVRNVLRGLGYDRNAATPHGFRSSFRDWCAESSVDDAVAEASLAHVVSDKVVAAYRRTRFLEARRDVMERWGLYLS
jgi:integrase